MTDPWEAVTFEGLRRDQERRWAQIPWSEKWEWLSEALESARDSGALGLALARKQAAIDAAWADQERP